MVAWARFVTPPCLRCSLILNYATHYTMLFDICQMLNEINRGYLVQKGTKGILNHEDTKGLEVLFDRIYRMITKGKKLSADFADFADGASRSRVATPWGSKLLLPSRNELLRAQSVLIRRLRRLAKLGLGDCGYCYGVEEHEDRGEGHEDLIDAAVPSRGELLRAQTVLIRRLRRLAKLGHRI